MTREEQIEQSAYQYGNCFEKHFELASMAFIKGAKWADTHLWHPADGDDLPEIDREVIAILNNGKVVFAHRPPEYWDGKNIDTCEVTRRYPRKFGKGGWNQPDVKIWLDCILPYKEGSEG